MSYGFRLFTFKLVKGVQGSRALPFEKCGPVGDLHAAEHLMRLLEDLSAYGNLSTMPHIRPREGEPLDDIEAHTNIPDDQLEHGDPKVRWLTSSASASIKHVVATFRYGTVGREEIAMSSAGPDSDIKGKAPAHPYRAEFYFPKTGTVGILALESVDGSNPIRVLHQWLARAAIEVGLEEGALTGNEPEVWKFSFNPMPDYPKLKSMIQNSASAEIRLFKHIMSGDGSKGTRVTKVKVVAKITEESEQDEAVGWATGLFEKAQEKFQAPKPQRRRRKRTEKELAEEKQAAAQTKADKQAVVAELEDIVDSVSGIGFDDGVLVLRDENGTVTKIGPNTLDDVFIYRITENFAPDDVQWRQAIEKVIVDHRKILGSEIELTGS